MSFYKMLTPVFKILDVLYVGQHPQSRGITEIRTPLAPPQEGPYFSNDPDSWGVTLHLKYQQNISSVSGGHII
jgi:hypothetical protein